MRSKRGVSLFEVMNKAPQTARPKRGISLGWSKRPTNEEPPPPLAGKGGSLLSYVAEPLSEEEAQTALAEQQARRDAAEQEKSRQAASSRQRRRLRLSWFRRSADPATTSGTALNSVATPPAGPSAAELSTSQEPDPVESRGGQSVKPPDTEPEVSSIMTPLDADNASSMRHRPAWARISGGRLLLSLNSGGLIAAAMLVGFVAVVAFEVGQRSGRANPKSVAQLRLAATTQQPMENTGVGAIPPAVTNAEFEAPAISDNVREIPNEEWIELHPDAGTEPASTRLLDSSAGSTAEPPRVLANSIEHGTPLNPGYNYLQIETFQATRYVPQDKLLEQLNDVQRFLAESGVRTFARQVDGRYVLYGLDGYPTDAENAGAREKLRTRVEELGRQYRQKGGLYEFRGCQFVNYTETRKGRPCTTL